MGFILGMLQMLLYAVYRKAEQVIEEKKQPEHLKSIVILGTLGTSEVYQVDVQPTVNEEEKEHEQTEEPDKMNEKSIEASNDHDHLQSNECAV